MNQNFKINFKMSKGNLHVFPKGDFDNFSACTLINLLDEQYKGEGRVFIDTQKLCNICPFGCSLFKNRLNNSHLPADRLFFKGENGFKIAPNGSRVIISHKTHECHCKVKCKKCKCFGNKKPPTEIGA